VAKAIYAVLTRSALEAGLLLRERFAFCPMTARAFSGTLEVEMSEIVLEFKPNHRDEE
jgi:hypothetical protein